MIIVVTNAKGGGGKTTTAVTSAAGLAALGYKVLVIDTDPQGHVALMLNLNNDLPDVPPKEIDGLYNWVMKKLPLEKCLYRVSDSRIPQIANRQRGELWVLPSSNETRLLQYDFQGVRIVSLAKSIMRLAEAFDYVLIDTQPTIDPFRSSFDAALMYTADGILVPTLCERLSVDGVTVVSRREELADLQFEAIGKRAELLGVLPIRWSNTQSRNFNLTALQEDEDYGHLVMDKIRDLTAWEKATNFFETVLTYDADSEAAAEAWNMVFKLEVICRQKALI